jgi:hypothetical protein
MAKVGLEGDKQAQASLKDLDLKLTKLKTKTADPEISLKGLEAAYFGIGRLNVALDKLDAKHVTATVDVKVNRRSLRGLLSGIGTEAQLVASGGAPGGGAGGLGGLLGPAAVGGGLLGAGLAPSLAGLGIGGLVGLGGAGAALMLAQKAGTTLAADQKSVNAAQAQLDRARLSLQNASTASARAGARLSIARAQALLAPAQQKLSSDKQLLGPFAPLGDVVPGIEKTLSGALAPIVGSAATFTRQGPGGHPLYTPATGLVAIFAQISAGLKTLSPLITQMFKASLPFVDAFLKLMLQAGKILIPAFTQSMNELVRSGALKQMTDALVILTKGLATFIVNLGPGMAASAQIFARLMTFIGRTLGFLGDAFTVIAKVLAFDFPAAVGKGTRAATAYFTSFWHLVTGGFRIFRSDLAAVWNTIWNNTVTRVQSGIATVVGFFRGLPGRVLAALSGLGHSLGNFASAALNEMWNGFKRIGGNILGWFTGFAKGIISVVKKVLGVFSPSSVFFDIGVNLMRGLEGGVKHGVGAAQAAARRAAQSTAAAGRAGAGVQQWRGTVLRALAMEHLSPGLVNDVLYQMQTESGGNPRAINLTDINAQLGTPSKGLMQVIDPTFRYWHWPGTSWNIYDPLANIAAALNYAAHGKGFGSGVGQIGSGHGYDRGGWLMPGAQIAVNNTGSPELVVPNSGRGSMAEVTALLRQLIAATQQAPARSGVAFARELNGSATRALR